MEVKPTEPARTFNVGAVEIKDMGKIALAVNELITLESKEGLGCDIIAKEWGYYLGPSLNARLAREGYKTALVVNGQHKVFVMVVALNKMGDFKAYLKTEPDHRVICWLDEWFKAEHEKGR